MLVLVFAFAACGGGKKSKPEVDEDQVETEANPDMVISAYERETFDGNLLDLFEPGFSPAFFPCFIDNAAFPPDWFDRSSACTRECARCGYCEQLAGQVLKEL